MRFWFRYTEKELDELQFTEFLFQVDQVEKEQARQAQQTMTAAAFTAWLQGAGQDKNFPEFLSFYGIGEKIKPIPKEKKRQMTEASRKTAEKILAMARKGKRAKW